MPSLAPHQLFRFIAVILFIVLVTPHSPAVAQQKPGPPSPQSQAQLEARVKELEARANAADQKAASAAMEKDYITRIQKQYEAYYEKVLSTQMWTLGIMGIILTAVFGLAAKFSLDIFDSRTKSSLDAALAQVERKFSEQMQKELETLGQQNSAQLKSLEEALTKRIAHLETQMTERISQQEEDLKNRSRFQFDFAQGLAAAADKRLDDARRSFRRALKIYKSGKQRGLFEKNSAVTTIRNIFISISNEDKAKTEEISKKEIDDELYDGLEEELALAAIHERSLGPLLAKRKQALSAPVVPNSKAGEATAAKSESPAVPNDNE